MVATTNVLAYLLEVNIIHAVGSTVLPTAVVVVSLAIFLCIILYAELVSKSSPQCLQILIIKYLSVRVMLII